MINFKLSTHIALMLSACASLSFANDQSDEQEQDHAEKKSVSQKNNSSEADDLLSFPKEVSEAEKIAIDTEVPVDKKDKGQASDGDENNSDEKLVHEQTVHEDAREISEDAGKFDPDVPEKLDIKKVGNDDKALAILKIADDHRNNRLHFSLQTSLDEAIRLYEQVIQLPEVSADLKGRAKLNISKIYIMLLKRDMDPRLVHKSQEQILQYINEILNDPTYSDDLKAWAGRFQAKLYLKGFYNMPPKEAHDKAFELLHKNLDAHHISAETRSRSRMQLAHGYLQNLFEAPHNNAVDLARALYQDVIEDAAASADIRVKARLALATFTEFYQDVPPHEVQKQRFDLYKNAMEEQEVSPILKAQLYFIVATNYLMNAFSATPEDARENALDLLENIVKLDGLPQKLHVFYTVKLAENYLNCSFNLTPSESRSRALKIYDEIPKVVTLTPEQNYDYKLTLANYHVRNAFFLKSEEANLNALSLFSSLLDNIDLTPKQRSNVRWILAGHYATHALVPVSSEPTHAAATLFNMLLSDPSLTEFEREEYRANLQNIVSNNGFGREQTQALLAAMPDLGNGK